jgi:membrane protease YdiL (CAAX protease family)
MIRFRDGWLRVASILALLLPVYFVLAALLTKFGLVDWRIGFGLMVFQLGALVLLAVLLITFVGLLLSVLVKPRRGWRTALAALLVPVLALGFVASVMNKTKTIPPIHDLATNIQDPPQFSPAVLAARAAVAGGNPVTSMTEPVAMLKGQSVGQAGQAANPDLASLTLPLAVPAATELAAKAATDMGLKVASTSPATGQVEATAESFWFGFKDDVAIRVRPGADGRSSIIDIRSTSRVGMSDLGANAKRIRTLLADIKARSGSPAK